MRSIDSSVTRYSLLVNESLHFLFTDNRINYQANDFLKQSFIGKAEVPGIGNDDVVNHLYIEVGTCILKFFRQLNVLIARLQISGGMVMTKNYRRRAVFHCRLKNHFCIYYSSGNTALA